MAVFTLTTWTQPSLPEKRKTPNPTGQSSLFLLSYPTSTTTPTLTSPGPLFLLCHWTRRLKYSSLKLFHKFSLRFCWYLNGFKVLTLFTLSKSGTHTVGTSWMNMWDTYHSNFQRGRSEAWSWSQLQWCTKLSAILHSWGKLFLRLF